MYTVADMMAAAVVMVVRRSNTKKVTLLEGRGTRNKAKVMYYICFIWQPVILEVLLHHYLLLTIRRCLHLVRRLATTPSNRLHN